MNLPTPPGFGPGYAAQRYSHTPMTRLPPGIAMYCSRRRGWGFWGGTYGYPPAGRGKPPPRSPPPEAIATTVQCPGHSYICPSGNPSPESLRMRLPTVYRPALPPPRGASEEAAGRAGWGLRVPPCERQGRGACPPPRRPLPQRGYPPRSSVLGLVEKNLIPSISVPHLTFSGKPSLEPLPIHGFPLAIATDRAGWGLGGGTYGYSPVGRGDPLPQWQ